MTTEKEDRQERQKRWVDQETALSELTKLLPIIKELIDERNARIKIWNWIKGLSVIGGIATAAMLFFDKWKVK